VTDAVTDTSERAHLNSLEVIFPRIAELATTEEVLTALAGIMDAVLTDRYSPS
jgi:isochorismate hydrolase